MQEAKFTWDAVVDENGNEMWKLVGWEGVASYADVVECAGMGPGARFYVAWFAPDIVEVIGDNRLSRTPITEHNTANRIGDNWCRIKAGDIFTPEQRNILLEVFRAAGKRLSQALKDKTEAPKPAPSNDICVVDSETEFTVTKGNRKAVLKWKKEGDNFRFNGVEGDIEIIPANWCVNLRHPVSGYDCGLALRIKTTAIDGVHLSTGGISSAYQRSMWNNMFFAAVTEYWRQLDAKEKSEADKKREAWLAQGRQVDVV